MSKWAFLNDNDTIREIIPEECTIPSIRHWYGTAFAEHCVEVPDDAEDGLFYDKETKQCRPYVRVKTDDEIVRDCTNELSASDYKIIKCFEYSLVGKPLPYNINALHATRQTLRDTIDKIRPNR